MKPPKQLVMIVCNPHVEMQIFNSCVTFMYGAKTQTNGRIVMMPGLFGIIGTCRF